MDDDPWHVVTYYTYNIVTYCKGKFSVMKLGLCIQYAITLIQGMFSLMKLLLIKNITKLSFWECRVWVSREGRMEAGMSVLKWVSLNASSVYQSDELNFAFCLSSRLLVQQHNCWMSNVDFFSEVFFTKMALVDLCVHAYYWTHLYCVYYRVFYSFFPRTHFLLLLYFLLLYIYVSFVHIDMHIHHLVLSAEGIQKLPLV